MALDSKSKPDVYVSSDDDEILHISGKYGANIYKRNANIANDTTTLDPVIFDAYRNISKQNDKSYDVIVTLQPTSPLLKTSSLDKAIGSMISDLTIDTIISAKDDTHLTWKKEGNKFVPNYEKRVNRQYLSPIFKETGGFLITRSSIISKNNRLGENVDLFLLSKDETIDIDTYEEFNICEYYLKHKTILFVVSGYNEIGFGHIYRSLLIANNIMDHRIIFLTDKRSQQGYEKIKESHYEVYIQQYLDIIEDIKAFNPDIVINDLLDTKKE